jgi:hypothetical protein
MAQTVYYNYDKNIIQGIKSESLSRAINAPFASKISNVKLGETPYFLQYMYFYKPQGSGDVYLVLQNTPDPNMQTQGGKNLFLAVKLLTGAQTETEIDAFLKANNTAKNVELNLNQYLEDGKEAAINTDPDGNITVLLKQNMGVKTALVQKTFYSSTIKGLSDLSAMTEYTNTIQKTILDWDISCDLVGEDNATEDSGAALVNTSGFMDNINMVMAFVLIIGGAYIAAPEIYGWIIIPIAKSVGNATPNKPFTAINTFWNVAFFMLIIQTIVFGASNLGAPFYMLAIGLTLLIFSVNKSLEDSIWGGTALSNAEQVVFHGETYNNDTKWSSMFPSEFGLEMGIKAACIIGMLGIWGANFSFLANKDLGDSAFQKFIITFPNYFLYAIAFTAWFYQGDDLTWIVIKWAAFLLSSGYIGVSMWRLFK